MARNLKFHKHTKHVDIHWHWVRELVSDGLINIVDCHDPDCRRAYQTTPMTQIHTPCQRTWPVFHLRGSVVATSVDCYYLWAHKVK